ncbi:AraC family transcriptional regulator [Conexibacter sp. SYSU D00693]|uniref:helix-turn-helix domain-containing protein n=1 Tax=Conexibacter sp. SYSU D00693 TaxID=2812560 RepID=UPI001F11A9B4|nr:AraC family transcriptional regulator [Conexibacter sp. SYSU D00693]
MSDDRLRDLLDLVLDSLDEPTDGRELARRAAFSRDHLDRLLHAATGETPVALRRRLLLERAAWQLRHGGATPTEAAEAAGYGSLAAFSRAFSRLFGAPPTAYASAAADLPLHAPAPNGVHFHAPAGVLLPGPARTGARGGEGAPPPGLDPVDRQLGHHVARTRDLLATTAALPPADLDRPVAAGRVLVWFEGEDASVRVMAERLVATLEVWVAAMAGEAWPEASPDPADPAELVGRFDHAAARFTKLVARLRERQAWDDAFVDALCEPPESFSYGGVVAHVLAYGAIRREALADALRELGVEVSLLEADPLVWEQRLRATAAARAPAGGRAGS